MCTTDYNYMWVCLSAHVHNYSLSSIFDAGILELPLGLHEPQGQFQELGPLANTARGLACFIMEVRR